jgi:three-Cys-motif partner protein
MNAFWDDDSWEKAAYKPTQTLFGVEDEKARNEVIADAFRKRLSTVGQFHCVPEPIPMTNRTGAVVYYLFFASQKKTAERIASHIFRKYRARGPR